MVGGASLIQQVKSIVQTFLFCSFTVMMLWYGAREGAGVGASSSLFDRCKLDLR